MELIDITREIVKDMNSDRKDTLILSKATKKYQLNNEEVMEVIRLISCCEELED
jgi:hypothetical protein